MIPKPLQKPLQALSKIGIAASEIIEAMRVDTNNSDNYLNEQRIDVNMDSDQELQYFDKCFLIDVH